jgi:dihydropteroate synthase
MAPRTQIMGVLNVTPDSFSDGGRFLDPARAFEHAQRMIDDGAGIIDVGGESTRPGADEVPQVEELRRVLPVVEALAREGRARISIDTRKPGVAAACLAAGATLVNDVTGLRDPAMTEAVRHAGAGIVIMHMKGDPDTMGSLADYRDVVAEVRDFLTARVAKAREAGIYEVIVDPGIGFAKTPAQSFRLLGRLRDFLEIGCPILIGPSRKSFLAALPGMESPKQRLEGTLAAVVMGALYGASIVRVHDVRACRKALDVVEAARNA